MIPMSLSLGSLQLSNTLKSTNAAGLGLLTRPWPFIETFFLWIIILAILFAVIYAFIDAFKATRPQTIMGRISDTIDEASKLIGKLVLHLAYLAILFWVLDILMRLQGPWKEWIIEKLSP